MGLFVCNCQEHRSVREDCAMREGRIVRVEAPFNSIHLHVVRYKELFLFVLGHVLFSNLSGRCVCSVHETSGRCCSLHVVLPKEDIEHMRRSRIHTLHDVFHVCMMN